MINFEETFSFDGNIEFCQLRHKFLFRVTYFYVVIDVEQHCFYIGQKVYVLKIGDYIVFLLIHKSNIPNNF